MKDMLFMHVSVLSTMVYSNKGFGANGIFLVIAKTVQKHAAKPAQKMGFEDASFVLYVMISPG